MKDISCERSVLSGLVQYGFKAYIDVSDVLNINCFTTDLNRTLYRCIELALGDNEIIDVALIYSAANTLGFTKEIIDSKEAANFIRALYSFPIEFSSVRPLVEKLVVLSIARKSRESHKEAFDKLGSVTGQESLSDLLAISEEPYSNLLHSLTGENDVQPASNDVDEIFDHWLTRKENSVGIPSPFKIWNYCIGGGLCKGVHLVAGRMKTGKSTIGKEIAVHASLNLKIPTLYIDTEMSKEEQDERIFAGLSLVDSYEIRNGLFKKDHAKLERMKVAKDLYKSMNYFHKNVAGQNFQSILSHMTRWIHKYVGIVDGIPNPHLIVYDYFKLTDSNTLKEMQEHQALGFQIAALHDFCQKYQTPVLSFVQINREGITRDGTDVISQSDRLGWNAVSLSIFRRKSTEEIAEDGVENGNVKLLPLEGRFMKKLDDGDYINFNLRPEFAQLKELNTRNNLKNAQRESGDRT